MQSLTIREQGFLLRLIHFHTDAELIEALNCSQEDIDSMKEKLQADGDSIRSAQVSYAGY